MLILYWVCGIALAGVWLEQLIAAALGIPTVADLTREEWAAATGAAEEAAPRACVVVPARNEEKDVAAALRSLLALAYPNYEVIAVDDRSTDSTGEILERVAAESCGRVRVLHIQSLPPRWLGKPHAMWRAAQLAMGQSGPGREPGNGSETHTGIPPANLAPPPEWLLFTDADIVFRPDALTRALACAQRSGCDHLALFPTVTMQSVGERMMMALFQTFFLFRGRAWKAQDPRARDYVGVGAFNLVRRSAYEKIGGFEALRMEVIEDLKLGRLIKEHGFTQRAAFGRGLVSLRWAHGAMGMVRNLSKNFFAFMRFEWWRALAACAAVGLLALGPLVGLALAPGWARLGYGLALAAIFALYLGMSTRCDIPAWYFLLHPVAALLFVYAIVRSMVVTLWHGGVIWRGTRYPLEELRREMV